MNIFWENMLRYPKFLITSISGLIIIVFGNFLKQMKKNQILFLSLIFLMSILLIIVFRLILNL